MPCTFDPRTNPGRAQGMFHCPECGEMVIAGMEHTPEWDDEMDASYVAYCLREWATETWYQVSARSFEDWGNSPHPRDPDTWDDDAPF